MINDSLGQPFLSPEYKIIEDEFMPEMQKFPVKKANKNNSKKIQEWQQNNLNKKYGFYMGRYIIQSEFGLIMHPNTRRLLEKSINDDLYKEVSKNNPFAM